MNLQLDPLVEETISECLSVHGVSDSIIEKAIENIHFCLKETNYLHNSVSDSNYHAAEIRKEDKLVSELKRERTTLEESFEKERDSLNYEIRMLRFKLEAALNE